MREGLVMNESDVVDQTPSVPGNWSPPSVDELLVDYAEVMNQSGGPESNDAAVFRSKHASNEEFQALARTAGFLWKRINKK